MSWWTKTRPITLSATAFFRGALPGPLASLPLETHGLRVLRELPPSEDAHWKALVAHPVWGEAMLLAARGLPPPPAELLDHDPRLSPAERALAERADSSVSVVLKSPPDGHALRLRKHLLQLLGVVSGDDLVLAVDHVSQAAWSPASLREELAHDADVDLSALFTIHSVSEGEAVFWHHTHGLAELGFVDLDVLDPGPPGLMTWEVLRVLAGAVVEGRLRVGGDPVAIVGGAPPARLVDAARVSSKVGASYPRWREALDPTHLRGHAVVCEAGATGFRAWLGDTPRPWSVLAGPELDDPPLLFSDDATLLMAERARATWSVFMGLHDELASLELPHLVKLRCPVRGGGHEHPWFEVHQCASDALDATLINRPFGDIGLAHGDRRRHRLASLTDWSVVTPVGMITPRHGAPLRVLRENRDEIEQRLRAHRTELARGGA